MCDCKLTVSISCPPGPEEDQTNRDFQAFIDSVLVAGHEVVKIAYECAKPAAPGATA